MIENNGIIGWIVIGLIAGGIAKLLMPGKDPGGCLITILLGIAGALLAGFIGKAIGWYEEGEAAGFIAAVDIVHDLHDIEHMGRVDFEEARRYVLEIDEMWRLVVLEQRLRQAELHALDPSWVAGTLQVIDKIAEFDRNGHALAG